MRIEKLILNNFRGIRDMSLEFSERINVLVGVNGAGKSSVLDALAILLSWAVARTRRAGSTARPVGELDINNRSLISCIAIHCSHVQSTYHWHLIRYKSRDKKGDRSVLHGASEFGEAVQKHIEASEGAGSVPLIAHYPVNRAVLDIPLRIRKRHDFNLLSAYDGPPSSGANFRMFFEWFRGREDYENERLREYHEDGFFRSGEKPEDCQLMAVRRAISKFTGFERIRVQRNPLRMEVLKEGQPLNVNQLSDGEKCLFALVGDLARRMGMANPDSLDPLKGEGVVLIDEIDLHLHPKWQRRVIPMLTEVFPNCQFLISTHSPQVISHVRPESIFLLRQTDEGIVADRASESYGLSTDRILEDLMGTDDRPEEIKERLARLYQQIDDRKLDKARREIEKIRGDIGDDRELTRADVLIKRMETIGK